MKNLLVSINFHVLKLYNVSHSLPSTTTHMTAIFKSMKTQQCITFENSHWKGASTAFKEWENVVYV